MALPATDTFASGGSDTALTTHSASWSYVQGTFTVTAARNDCSSATASVDCVARWNADSFGTDQYSQAALGIAGGTFIGVSVRGQTGAATAYFYDTSGSAGEIQRLSAGSTAQLQTDSQTWANGDICRLEVSGTGATVTLTVKRAAAATPTVFSTVQTFGDTNALRITTAGAPGVYGFGSNPTNAGVDNWEGGNLAPPATLEQEGFRGRNDDGSETTATWIATQDTNFSGPLDSNTRIRFVINASNDPSAIAYQLEYKLHADSVYIKAEPNGAGALATGTAGTTGTGGTTTCNVPYPATPARGDIFIAVVGNRPNANTPDDIANWTKVTSTGGAGSEGAGIGTIRNTIYYKESDGTESGNLAVACTSGTSMFGSMLKYSKTTGKKWSIAVVHGPDNAAGTDWSATAASDPGLSADDFLICASVNSEDTAEAASEAVTATGCTFGSMSEKKDSGITTGNDLGIIIADFPVSTGPSSAAPVFTMTMSGTNAANSAGCTAFIRLRQVTQPVQMSLSGSIAAGGEATTALLTAPSGKSTSDFVTGRMWDDENGTDTIDITTDDYTELEWCIKALAAGGAANADAYDLRVTNAGTVLDTYTLTPQWTIGSSDVSTGLGGSAVTMGAGTQGPGIAVPL